MADGGDFYSRDRPDDAQFTEDRPRGGGPEDRSTRTGPRHIWLWWVLAAVVILVLFLIFI